MQLIGMSATLPNAQAVADWLGADLFETSFRPVPLEQRVKLGRQLLGDGGVVVRELEADPTWEAQDPDHLALLCKETIEVC